jgi:hypothetical protein
MAFVFTGPGTLYYLANETTGDRIWFDNLVIQQYETLTLKLGTNPQLYSNYYTGARRGINSRTGFANSTSPLNQSLINYVLPGSSITSFHLVPGVNKISCLVDGATGGTTGVTLHYKSVFYGTTSGAGVTK